MAYIGKGSEYEGMIRTYRGTLERAQEWPDELGEFGDFYAALHPPWHRHALCHGKTELFFPERGDNAIAAKRICAECPVRVECWEAGRSERVGIWGGESRGRHSWARRQKLKKGEVA